jgi:hypothetical protein
MSVVWEKKRRPFSPTVTNSATCVGEKVGKGEDVGLKVLVGDAEGLGEDDGAKEGQLSPKGSDSMYCSKFPLPSKNS